MIQRAEYKKQIIKSIITELKEIPDYYLLDLYSIVHNFRVHLPESIQKLKSTTIENEVKNIKTENETFDWDNLLDEIHHRRNVNNQYIASRIQNLIKD